MSRRLEDAERTRLKDIVKRLDPKGGIIVRTAAEGASAEDIERDRLPAAPLEDDPDQDEDRNGSDARVRGGGVAPADREISSPATSSARRSTTIHAPAHRQLPEEDVAAHGRTGASIPRQGASVRRVRRGRRNPLDAPTTCGSALGRIPRLRLRGGLYGHRRQHRSVRRLAWEERPGPPRGHDRQEQPRSGEGGRAPASPSRDIGGIIVIDFIDMANPKNRETVEEALRSGSSVTGRRRTSSRSPHSGSSR